MAAKPPNFVWIRKLGQGSYGEVYLAREGHSEQPIAVKLIPRSKLSKRGEDNLVSEISILKKLRHPHIVRLSQFYWDANKVYLVMEYCGGGDLSHFIRAKQRLPENLVRRFLRQLASALQYLRQMNVVHMDLKPQNILLTSITNPVLKVTDFGFAKCTESPVKLKELRGTLLYMAPEVFFEGLYHPSCDLWSVGVILYECLFGTPPYASVDLESFERNLKEDKPVKIPSSPRISANCTSLLRGLLKRDVAQRMTHEDFFEHPFIDLKHAPGPQSFDKATHHLELAQKAESAGQLEMARTEYTHGLAYLVSAVEYESSPSMKKELKELALHYFDRAEKLKENVTAKEPTTVPQSGTKNATCQPKIRPTVAMAPRKLPPPTSVQTALSSDLRKPEPVSDQSAKFGILRRLKSLFVSVDSATVPETAPSVSQGQPRLRCSPKNADAVPSRSPRPRSLGCQPGEKALVHTGKISQLSLSIQDRSGSSYVDHCRAIPKKQHSPVSPQKRVNRSPSQPAGTVLPSNPGKMPAYPTTPPPAPSNKSPNVAPQNPSQPAASSSSPPANDTPLTSPEQVHRLRSLTGHPRPNVDRTDNTSPPGGNSSYVNKMAFLFEFERISELKSMCTVKDTEIIEVVSILERFYTLLRTREISQALAYIEELFPTCLDLSKADTNYKRRRAVLKELKIVLDFMDWGKQMKSTGSDLNSDEIGTEALASTTPDSCRLF